MPSVTQPLLQGAENAQPPAVPPPLPSADFLSRHYFGRPSTASDARASTSIDLAEPSYDSSDDLASNASLLRPAARLAAADGMIELPVQRALPSRRWLLVAGALSALLLIGAGVAGVVVWKKKENVAPSSAMVLNSASGVGNGFGSNSTLNATLAPANTTSTALLKPSTTALRSTAQISTTAVTTTVNTTVPATSTPTTTTIIQTTTEVVRTTTRARPSSTTAPSPPPPSFAPNAPFGVFNSCNQPGVVAITFDDGPFAYTPALLDLLDREGVKATFFVNGRNQGNLNDPYYAGMMQRAAGAGHCIGSHTWSHRDLTTLNDDVLRSEISQIEDSFVQLLGKKPSFLRPPYGSYNQHTLDVIASFGYSSVVIWNYDTDDWAHPQDVGASLGVYQNALNNQSPQSGNILILDHDVVPTVTTLIQQAIDAVQSRGGWRFVSMDECLGRPCYR
ncbi:chitin deacetylase [Gonapodya sp. JEL0774]|nr:chitin deacetylase [Gonapodya sp. JEL0774]